MVKSEEFNDLKVTSAPTDSEDVPRKQEHDTKADNPHDNSQHSEAYLTQAAVDEKADKDGGGTGTLANYAEIDTDHLNDVRYVKPTEDFHTVVSDPGAYILAPGDHAVSQSTTIVDGMTIVGTAESRIVPTADTEIFRFATDGFAETTFIANLDIALSAQLDAYSSPVITFFNSSTGGGRYENGPSYVRNCIINGGSAAGSGSTGILFEATGGEGVSWINIENVRITHCEYGVRLHTMDSGSWINGNTIRNIHPLACRVGYYEDIDTGMEIKGNVVRLICNGSSSIDKFFHIEGLGTEMTSHVWDASNNNATYGYGTVHGNYCTINTQGDVSAVLDEIEITGSNVTLSNAGQRSFAWMPDGDPPGWLSANGAGSIRYSYYNSQPSVKVETDGADGSQMSLDRGERMLRSWHMPHFSTAFSIDQTTGIESFVGLGASDGLGCGIVADPTDQLGTGITANFVAVADDGTTFEYSDTGVALDTGRHHARVYMSSDKTGIAMDGARHHLFTGSFSTRPVISVTQRGSSARTINAHTETNLIMYGQQH